MRPIMLLLATFVAQACIAQPAMRRPHPAFPRSPRPAAHAPRLTFVPDSPSFADAAREYQQLWSGESDRIVRAMESVSGLAFRDTAVRVTVYEGISLSGYRDVSPMKMRASYSADTKKATLIHELGHRLQSGLFRRDEEEHGPLFLWLYDVWVDLYGREFADAQVAIEKRRRGPYPKAWEDALALTRAERAARWQALLAERMPTRR